MYLEKLHLINYRNIENLKLEFSKKFTIIYGDNAQGKTNIIESIYLFCYLKSFRHYKNIDLIGKKYNKASIVSFIENKGKKNKYNIKISSNNKKIYIDDKITKSSICLEYIKSLIYYSEELNILRNSNNERKNFIDRGIFLNDHSYSNLVNKYLYILKSRNQLLKNKKINDLNVWTELLIEIGTEIRIKRYNYLYELNLFLDQIYKNIFNKNSSAYIVNDDYSLSLNVLKNNFYNSLVNKRNYEISYGKTLDGPHLDKFDFNINENNSRFYGSQGELRAFLFSIKISQLFLFKKKFGIFPIFLIDDISSEIDSKKLVSLFEFMNSEIGQIIITSTNKNFIDLNKYKNNINYEIEDGNIK